MSESDREKLLKLRGVVETPEELERVSAGYVGKVEVPQITGVVTIETDWIPHAPPKRPMTEAEEKLIAAALKGPAEALNEAVAAVETERFDHSKLAELFEVRELYIKTRERLQALRADVPRSVLDAEYRKRGLDGTYL